MASTDLGKISTKEEYKKHKQQKHLEMVQKQSAPYRAKVAMAQDRIRDFIDECEKRDLNCHVSVGGLDSITLLFLIRSMGYGPDKIPAVSASGLEDKSIQKVHRQIGVEIVHSAKNKVRVLQEEGFPVLSKKVANKIMTIQNATPESATVRHAIITGECGAVGHYAKNSKMQLPKTYLKLFGGWDEEGAALGYEKPDFLVSSKCCYYLKEKPCDDWAKEHNSVPFLGLMASEGGQRADALEENGCNYFGKTTIRSAPFAFFYHWDLVRLANDLCVPIPEIYGEVKHRKTTKNLEVPAIDRKTGEIVVITAPVDVDEYYTTGEQRTGCSMCGFGIQMETRPHRFDRLYQRNPKEWEFWMNRCVKDKDGNPFGWGRVLDYIGIPWRDPEHWYLSDTGIKDQLSIFDWIY